MNTVLQKSHRVSRAIFMNRNLRSTLAVMMKTGRSQANLDRLR